MNVPKGEGLKGEVEEFLEEKGFLTMHRFSEWPRYCGFEQKAFDVEHT